MSEDKTPTPAGYRSPDPVEPEPEYMTTVGMVEMRDEFNPTTKHYNGYVCRKATDPIVPPGGPAQWKLFSTNTHQVEFYRSKPNEAQKYDMSFIALIWTWQRVHPE
jgi:hypothetical protein